MCETQQMQRQVQQNQQMQQQAQEQVRQNRNLQRNRQMQQTRDVLDQLQTGGHRYQNFMNSLRPLPSVPAAGDANAQAGHATNKAQKRREKAMAKQRADEYAGEVKKLQEKPRFTNAQELKGLAMFQTREGREQWKNQVLPHSTQTRQETLEQILKFKDYSNFENLDLPMRNLIAAQALKEFRQEYGITEESDVDVVCRQIMEKHKGVSGLLNPAVRLGLSLAQKEPEEAVSDRLKAKYRELDERLSTEVMVQTLIHKPDENSLKDAVREKMLNENQTHGHIETQVAEQTRQMVEANKAQQIQIAKRLLLMQMSHFRIYDKEIVEEGKKAAHWWQRDEKPVTKETERAWDKPVAVALSHCSRVALTLPEGDGLMENYMWNSITTTRGGNPAQDNRRGSSTHNILRRRVSKAAHKTSKEEKVPFNLIGQYGMNCAIGGLGNAGISGKAILNDGSCGHFYSMHRMGDQNHYGTMLFGLESDANGVTNQMGHTHDWHATAEKASSLGGQRTDEIGNKYSGRQCDLTDCSSEQIWHAMMNLERAMTTWQENGEDAKLEELARNLAGVKLSWGELQEKVLSKIEKAF